MTNDVFCAATLNDDPMQYKPGWVGPAIMVTVSASKNTVFAHVRGVLVNCAINHARSATNQESLAGITNEYLGDLREEMRWVYQRPGVRDITDEGEPPEFDAADHEVPRDGGPRGPGEGGEGDGGSGNDGNYYIQKARSDDMPCRNIAQHDWPGFHEVIATEWRAVCDAGAVIVTAPGAAMEIRAVSTNRIITRRAVLLW